MVAMVLVGMSNLLVALALTALVLVDKLAPPVARRHELILALAVTAAGVAYAVLG